MTSARGGRIFSIPASLPFLKTVAASLIDGRLVPWAEATVHVLSHSHQRGSLVFDYLGAHQTPRGPAVFRLDDHVRRFLASIEMVGLPLRQDAAAIRAAILEAVRANPGAKSIKVSAYLASVEVDVPRGGEAPAFYAPPIDFWGAGRMGTSPQQASGIWFLVLVGLVIAVGLFYTRVW